MRLETIRPAPASKGGKKPASGSFVGWCSTRSLIVDHGAGASTHGSLPVPAVIGRFACSCSGASELALLELAFDAEPGAAIVARQPRNPRKRAGDTLNPGKIALMAPRPA
jgi:hypothetical protein